MITITINSFDISTNSFDGISVGFLSRTQPFTGTIEEYCTGLISGNAFGGDTFFTFDSENYQLYIDGFGIFSVDAFPWNPYR